MRKDTYVKEDILREEVPGSVHKQAAMREPGSILNLSDIEAVLWNRRQGVSKAE